jgi:hypothetical protein
MALKRAFLSSPWKRGRSVEGVLVLLLLNDWIILNNKSSWMLKEAAGLNWRHYLSSCLEGLRKTTKILRIINDLVWIRTGYLLNINRKLEKPCSVTTWLTDWLTNKLYRAETLLRSKHSYWRNAPCLMEPEGSLHWTGTHHPSSC